MYLSIPSAHTIIEKQAQRGRNFQGLTRDPRGRWLKSQVPIQNTPVQPTSIEQTPASEPVSNPSSQSDPNTLIQKWQKIKSNIERTMMDYRNQHNYRDPRQLNSDRFYQRLVQQYNIAQNKINNAQRHQQSGISTTAVPFQASSSPDNSGFMMNTTFDQGPTNVDQLTGMPSTLTSNPNSMQTLDVNAPEVQRQIETKQRMVNQLTNEIQDLQRSVQQSPTGTQRNRQLPNFSGVPARQPTYRDKLKNWASGLVEQARTAV